MSTRLRDINGALLLAYGAADLGLATAYENREYRHPDAQPWARVINLWSDNQPVSLGIDGHDRFSGIFQIDIFTPENTSTGLMLSYADKVIGYFTAGTRYTLNGHTVMVRRCRPSPMRRDPEFGYMVMSLSVYWEATLARGVPTTGGTNIPGDGVADASYEFTQTTPVSEWVINHNLGRHVATDVYSTGGVQVFAEVINVTLNQTVVRFDSPQSGYAIIN